MTTVVLFGSAGKDAIGDGMARVLSAFGGAVYYSGSRLFLPEGEKKARFCIYETEEMLVESNAKGIFVFKNSLPDGISGRLPKGFVPVLDAKNLRAAALLKGAENIALTCGSSVKNTLSIASLDYTRAVLSLQRGLTALAGEKLEPHDITVNLRSPLGVFPLLVCCAVLLLAGEPSAEGYSFP